MNRVLKWGLGIYGIVLVVHWVLIWTGYYRFALAAQPWAGPWRAQVVDAETGKPLEGVVVLAWWAKYYSSVGGWAEERYYASEEVVTGPDGRFVIQAQRWAVPLLPFIDVIAGPEFRIFKPGYGQWHFQGDPVSKLPPQERLKAYHERFDERNTWIAQQWARFRSEGVVIELPPLKTRAERRSFDVTRPTGVVPLGKMQRLTKAQEEHEK